MKQKDPLIMFFFYFVLGFLISALNMSIEGKAPTELVKDLFLRFMYNYTVGVSTGISGMFGSSLYFWIKKNLKNERYKHLYWVW